MRELFAVPFRRSFGGARRGDHMVRVTVRFQACCELSCLAPASVNIARPVR